MEPDDQGAPIPLMAMRPLDRLPSIRAKLGAVIVFAVAMTILIMYLAVGFALRRTDRDRQFRQALDQAKTVQALSFGPSGSPARNLSGLLGQLPGPVLVVDHTGQALFRGFSAPPPAAGVSRLLSGSPLDTGKAGNLAFVGVSVIRNREIVGAVYVGYRVERGGILGAVSDTAGFVRSIWWQLLVAGALAAFIALGLARILARGLTQPIRDMAGAVRQMARGEYRQRVPVRSRDELGQLAEGFNHMAGEMEGLERLRRDLVANVSHELKTPISAIRAHLENLMDGVEEPNPALLAVMVQQAERLSRLVDQLLDLSKLESGDVPLQLEPVELSPLVERIASEVQMARSDRGVHLRNEIAQELPPVHADRERLHQVLFNLLDNAYRFSPRGGVVTVQAIRDNGSCEVSVEDNGPGIPSEHLPLVFERFYRVDQSRSRDDGGTGIGLAIARSVVEAHGGRIWAENGTVGAKFRFVLPMGQSAAAASLAANGDGGQRRPVRVGRQREEA
jgi:signal transduction histidine kinase